uniref:Secreted protein n=1 Tax=Mesocestoides corti TaxID=53468 RepID=A0A5K3EX79_MESCO
MDEVQYIWCGVGSGRRHVGPPGCSQSCVSVFQWHARKISSQPEKDTNRVQYIMSVVTRVVDWDGRLLKCGSA